MVPEEDCAAEVGLAVAPIGDRNILVFITESGVVIVICTFDDITDSADDTTDGATLRLKPRSGLVVVVAIVLRGGPCLFFSFNGTGSIPKKGLYDLHL
jgi:hypothetical protein